MSIPKIIHYCWFGGKPKPELARKCIRSWEKFCPDYEIIRWDENGRLAERGESLKWISSRISRPWDSEINTFPTLHNPPGHQSNLLAAGNLLC